jgi:uncharacterized protein (DUF1330 family)
MIGVMSAYMVSEVKFLDDAKGQEYRELSGRSISLYGGRYVVRGAPIEVAEGEWGPGQGIVVVEFPTMEQLHRWYDSPEYGEARAIAQSALKRRMRLFFETSPDQ